MSKQFVLSKSSGQLVLDASSGSEKIIILPVYKLFNKDCNLYKEVLK